MRKAIICFLEKDDELLLLLTDYGDKKVWNGVSGYIDGDETEIEAAVRETKEEIGIDLESSSIRKFGKKGIFTICVAKDRSGEPKSKEESIKELRWFNISKLPYESMHEGTESWLPPMINNK